MTQIFFTFTEPNELTVNVYANTWAQVTAFARARMLSDEPLVQDNACPLCQRWLDDATCYEDNIQATEEYACACGAKIKYVSSVTFANWKLIDVDLGGLKED